MATKSKDVLVSRQQEKMVESIIDADNRLAKIGAMLEAVAQKTENKDLYLKLAEEIMQLRYILRNGPLTPDLQDKTVKEPESTVAPSDGPGLGTKK